MQNKLDEVEIHIVNLIEVQRKLHRSGMTLEDVRRAIAHLQIPVETVITREQAESIALLYSTYPELSLGDCVCISMAQCHGRIALTTDRAWSRMGTFVELLR